MNSGLKNARMRLPDEVGRRDAGDAQAVGDLGRDRRLAGAGRPSDEHDDRKVELLQVAIAAEAPGCLLALPLARAPRRRGPGSGRARPCRSCGRGDPARPAARARRRERPRPRRASGRGPSGPSNRAHRPPPSGSGSVRRRSLIRPPAGPRPPRREPGARRRDPARLRAAAPGCRRRRTRPRARPPSQRRRRSRPP